MPPSIFRAQGEAFLPTEHARGPWDPQALHGGAPAALMAGALERLSPDENLIITRLTYEFLRPVPMAPLRLSTRFVRAGRRVQELESELQAGDRPVCQLRALRLRATDAELPDVEDSPRMPGPEAGQPIVFSLEDSSRAGFAASAMDMRWLDGGPGLGPGRVWMRLRHPVVNGQPLTSLMRLVAAADFGNGVSATLSWEDYLFVNADLTVYLQRPPQGEWIGLDSRTHLHRGGAGVAESVLYDARGPVGRALQALVVQRR